MWRDFGEVENSHRVRVLFFFHFDHSLQLNEFKGIFDIKCVFFFVIFSVLWNITIQNLFSEIGIYTIFWCHFHFFAAPKDQKHHEDRKLFLDRRFYKKKILQQIAKKKKKLEITVQGIYRRLIGGNKKSFFNCNFSKRKRYLYYILTISE